MRVEAQLVNIYVGEWNTKAFKNLKSTMIYQVNNRIYTMRSCLLARQPLACLLAIIGAALRTLDAFVETLVHCQYPTNEISLASTHSQNCIINVDH
jgi:hypothetical protein